MKKLILFSLLALVLGVAGFVAYAVFLKPKPRANRPQQQVELPAPEVLSSETASMDPGNGIPDLGGAPSESVPSEPALTDLSLESPPASAEGSVDGPGAAEQPDSMDPMASDPAVVTDQAPNPEALSAEPAIETVTPAETPVQASPPESPPEAEPVVASEAAPASPPKKSAPSYASRSRSLLNTWKNSPLDNSRPIAALAPLAKPLAPASKTTLLAHTDFIEQRPGVYTAMLLWSGPKPQFEVRTIQPGLVSLEIDNAKLAVDLPPTFLSSFTAGPKGDAHRFVYGGFGGVSLDVAESKNSAIITLLDSGTRANSLVNRSTGSRYTAVVMGEAPQVKPNMVLAPADCERLTQERLAQMARDGMPIDQCLNVVYNRPVWYVQAVSSHGAVLRRGASTVSVTVGSVVPDMGKVKSLDPLRAIVLTDLGPISPN